MAGFVQIIEYRTSQLDEIRKLGEKYRDERMSENDGSPVPRVTITADRDNPGTYRTIVEFPSYEEAMANSQREDTSHFAKRMMELCDGTPTFYNLDVIDQS